MSLLCKDGQAKPEGKDIDSLCKTLNIDAAESHSVIGEGCVFIALYHVILTLANKHIHQFGLREV